MTRHVVVGTAGHIDHGKTALVRALTGVDTDRLAEEKRRGITIELGFAHLTLPDGTSASIVDVPGHEDFIRNMVAGASGIDVALLVVAADEGVMPQTREHLAILRMLDVRAAVIALTRCDLVDPEWLELAREDVRGHLAGGAYERARVVAVSARTGMGLDALRDAIVAAASGAVRPESEASLFRMPADRAFTVHGTGTVVTGTVRDGAVAVGDEVLVLPSGRTARVRALQQHGDAVDRVARGTRAAIALAGIEIDAAGRGSWIVSTGWPLTSMITARLELLDDAGWEVRQRQRVHVHIGTAAVTARVVLLDHPLLAPGAGAWAQLRLESPVVARYGDRFVLRSWSPVTTIGGGRVLEPFAAKRRRLTDDERALLSLLDESGDAALPVALRLAGANGIALSELPLRFGLPASVPVGSRAVQAGDRLFAADVLAEAADRLLRAVEGFHARHPLRLGLDRAEARRACGLADELADVAIDREVEQGRLRVVQGVLALPGFEPRADDAQGSALERLTAVYEAAGLAAPRLEELPADLAGRPDLRDLLALLERQGALAPFGPDRLVHAPALEAAGVRLAAALGGRDGLGPGDFREVFDLPRRHLIPLLELFDRLGWTRRAGDLRSVAQKGAGIPHPVP